MILPLQLQRFVVELLCTLVENVDGDDLANGAFVALLKSRPLRMASVIGPFLQAFR